MVEIIRTVRALARRVTALEADRPAGKSRAVSTTNATGTTLITIAVPTDTTLLLQVHVAARRTGGTAGTAGDGAGYVRILTIRNIAGVVSQIGATTGVHTAESQAGWDVTFAVSGTNLLVQVTGAVNNNVAWYGWVQVWRVSS